MQSSFFSAYSASSTFVCACLHMHRMWYPTFKLLLHCCINSGLCETENRLLGRQPFPLSFSLSLSLCSPPPLSSSQYSFCHLSLFFSPSLYNHMLWLNFNFDCCVTPNTWDLIYSTTYNEAVTATLYRVWGFIHARGECMYILQ